MSMKEKRMNIYLGKRRKYIQKKPKHNTIQKGRTTNFIPVHNSYTMSWILGYKFNRFSHKNLMPKRTTRKMTKKIKKRKKEMKSISNKKKKKKKKKDQEQENIKTEVAINYFSSFAFLYVKIC